MFSKKLGNMTYLDSLLWYDGPQIFTCISASGQKYIVFIADYNDKGINRLYVPLTEIRLEEILSGKMTLRDCLLKSENGWVLETFETRLEEFQSEEYVKIKYIEELTEDDLPAEGTFLN